MQHVGVELAPADLLAIHLVALAEISEQAAWVDLSPLQVVAQEAGAVDIRTVARFGVIGERVRSEFFPSIPGGRLARCRQRNACWCDVLGQRIRRDPLR